MYDDYRSGPRDQEDRRARSPRRYEDRDRDSRSYHRSRSRSGSRSRDREGYRHRSPRRFPRSDWEDRSYHRPQRKDYSRSPSRSSRHHQHHRHHQQQPYYQHGLNYEDEQPGDEELYSDRHREADRDRDRDWDWDGDRDRDRERERGRGGPILTGETDACPQQNPSQYVVIRDLGPGVTEEVLSNGVQKLFKEEKAAPARPTNTPHKLKSTAPTNDTTGLGARPGSLRRVFLMRDRKSNQSWKYGFAEFASLEDAQGAIAKFRNSDDFTIASRSVFIAFIHSGVFIPAEEPVTQDNSHLSIVPIYNPTVRLRYWDDRAYPSAHVVNMESGSPSAASPDKSGDANEQASGKKLKKDAANKKALAMAPQMAKWAQKSAELASEPGLKSDDGSTSGKNGREPAMKIKIGGGTKLRALSSTERPTIDVEVEEETIKKLPGDEYISYGDHDRCICLVCRRKFTSPDLLVWHETHTHQQFADDELRERAANLLSEAGKQPTKVVVRVPESRPDSFVSYADKSGLVCYLCRRQFADLEVMRRHETQSHMHLERAQDAALVAQAEASLAGLGLRPSKVRCVVSARSLLPQYRDRALERRQAFNQPNRPKPQQQPSQQGKAAAGGGGDKRGAPDGPTEEAQSAAKKSKGAALLGKMGWSQGEGLGAEGNTGLTAALTAELYAPGVGLGAQGGKLGDASEEAARKTKGEFDLIEKTRDSARERFARLG